MESAFFFKYIVVQVLIPPIHTQACGSAHKAIYIPTYELYSQKDCQIKLDSII